ncbi:MAG: hypothetical protein ACI8PZ_004595 [Myxococcota bacterium]|jgi:hypothetical protein
MTLLWLLACGAHPAVASDPEPPAPPVEAAPAAVAPQAPAATECSTDADCAVVHAFAGLDHIPAEPGAATCGDLCFTAIPAAEVTAWRAALAADAGAVACSRKQAKCGNTSARAAACLQGQCEVVPR